MSQWSDFPNEILIKIFEYAKEGEYQNQTTLGQCALTCRSWKKAAQMLFFETIRVSNIIDLRKAKSVLNNNSDGFSSGNLVKKVRYQFEYIRYRPDAFYRGCGYELLDLIDENFPYLEELDYHPHSLPELRYLFHFLSAGRFKCLKQISTSSFTPYFRRNYTEEFKECVRILRERNCKNTRIGKLNMSEFQ